MNSNLIKTDGLVIRGTEYGENDCIYSVLTPQMGRIAIKAKAAQKSNSFLQKISVGFYMNFVLYKKGDLCWIRESELKEPFFNLRQDLCASALSGYIMDVAYELSDDNQDCYDILAVTYNCLYALNYKKELPLDIVKAAFDLKAMSTSGYMPDVTHCECCSKLEGDLYLDVMEGGIICSSCLKKKRNELPYVDPYDTDFHVTQKILCPLNPDVICAMHYIICAPYSKMLSFRLDDEESIYLLERACKTYLINHLERDFDSLKYYYSIKSEIAKASKQKK